MARMGMKVDGNRVTTPVRFGLDPFRSVGVEWIYGHGRNYLRRWTRSAATSSLSVRRAWLNWERPSPLEEGLTPQKLAGTWGYDNPDLGKGHFRYHEDGTYEMVRNITGSETLWDVGTYEIEGDTVTLTTSEAHYCKIGTAGVYQMSITEDGLLESTAVDDACWRRKPPVDGPVYLTPATP